MARFSLIPKTHQFFEDFAAFAVELRKGAQLLDDMLAVQPPRWELADRIKEAEHTCDQLTHGILHRLHQTFITPFDREDIHALARSLDDVMDAIDAAAGFVRLYKLVDVRPGVRELSGIIVQQTEELKRAIQGLETRGGIPDSIVEINRLENEADRLHSEAVGRLFKEEKDPIAVIKWRDVINFLEEATDRCEDVANVLEGVVVKYA